MAAEAWIASELSSLNRFCTAIAYLHQIFVFQKAIQLRFAQRSISSRKNTKIGQFVIVDIRSILLRKQIFVNPCLPSFIEKPSWL